MSPQLSIVIIVVVVVVGWFAAGTHFNVRKGESALRWLQDGLPLVGEKTNLRWLGSSAVELKLTSVKAPFRDALVLVLLEPRDVPLIWWYSRLRGRRDLLIFRSALARVPTRELEVLDPSSWSTRSVHRRVKAENWAVVTAPAPLTAYASGPVANAPALIQAATLDSCPPVRLSVRRSEPNLELQWRLDDVRKHSSRELFEAIRRTTTAL